MITFGPMGNADQAVRYLDQADYTGPADSTLAALARCQVAALQGVAYALLAIEGRLDDANDHAAELAAHARAIADQLGDLAVPADRLADAAETLVPRRRRWLRRRRVYREVCQPATMTDTEVMTSLISLWSGGTWQRLDIRRTQAGGIGGYCIQAGGKWIGTSDALCDPASYPPGIGELADLFAASGWQRFEVTGDPASGECPDGWCERPDGSGIRVGQWALPGSAPYPAAGQEA